MKQGYQNNFNIHNTQYQYITFKIWQAKHKTWTSQNDYPKHIVYDTFGIPDSESFMSVAEDISKLLFWKHFNSEIIIVFEYGICKTRH